MKLVKVTDRQTVLRMKAVQPQQPVRCNVTDQSTAAHIVYINPVPSCYGLIGWNGAVLTVT